MFQEGDFDDGGPEAAQARLRKLHRLRELVALGDMEGVRAMIATMSPAERGPPYPTNLGSPVELAIRLRFVALARLLVDNGFRTHSHAYDSAVRLARDLVNGRRFDEFDILLQGTQGCARPPFGITASEMVRLLVNAGQLGRLRDFLAWIAPPRPLSPAIEHLDSSRASEVKEDSADRRLIQHVMAWNCHDGNTDVVRMLYHYGASFVLAPDFDVSPSFKIPLIAAANNGHVEILRFALANPPFRVVRNPLREFQVLTKSVVFGLYAVARREVVELLLDFCRLSGENPAMLDNGHNEADRKERLYDASQHCALGCLAEGGDRDADPECVTLLLRAGFRFDGYLSLPYRRADLQIGGIMELLFMSGDGFRPLGDFRPGDMAFLRAAVEIGGMPIETDDEKTDLVRLAIGWGRLNALQYLVGRGANLRRRVRITTRPVVYYVSEPFTGDATLFSALPVVGRGNGLTRLRSEDVQRVLAYLLDQGLDPSLDIHAGFELDALLPRLIRLQLWDSVRYLLSRHDAGAGVRFRRAACRTPIEYAALYGAPGTVIDMLFQRGATLHFCNPNIAALHSELSRLRYADVLYALHRSARAMAMPYSVAFEAFRPALGMANNNEITHAARMLSRRLAISTARFARERAEDQKEAAEMTRSAAGYTDEARQRHAAREQQRTRMLAREQELGRIVGEWAEMKWPSLDAEPDMLRLVSGFFLPIPLSGGLEASVQFLRSPDEFIARGRPLVYQEFWPVIVRILRRFFRPGLFGGRRDRPDEDGGGGGERSGEETPRANRRRRTGVDGVEEVGLEEPPAETDEEKQARRSREFQAYVERELDPDAGAADPTGPDAGLVAIRHPVPEDRHRDYVERLEAWEGELAGNYESPYDPDDEAADPHWEFDFEGDDEAVDVEAKRPDNAFLDTVSVQLFGNRPPLPARAAAVLGAAPIADGGAAVAAAAAAAAGRAAGGMVDEGGGGAEVEEEEEDDDDGDEEDED